MVAVIEAEVGPVRCGSTTQVLGLGDGATIILLPHNEGNYLQEDRNVIYSEVQDSHPPEDR